MALVPEVALVARADDIEIDFGEPLVIPDRSVLYHLRPIARGTALRESLSSFLLRLADQHTVNPSARRSYRESIDAAPVRGCAMFGLNLTSRGPVSLRRSGLANLRGSPVII